MSSCAGQTSSCAEAQFIRADDSVLIGFAANVSLVDTIEECVATCTQAENCKSAMYFYEEGECITNTESALSRPNSFAREDTEKVIYFQNGCLAKSAFIESSTQPVAAIDSDTKKSKSVGTSAELPISEEETTEEEVTTTKKPKRAKSTTTTTAASTDSEEIDDEESFFEEEEKSTILPATTTTRTAKYSKKELEENIKYKKHPKNFGTKTVHYKHQKEKPGIPKIEDVNKPVEDGQDEEEVDAAESAVEGEVVDNESANPNVPSDPYTTFFSEWSDWTPCKTSGERRIRRRKCLDLRRCLGALMQVENCPAIVTPAPELITEDAIESVRSVVAAPLEGDAFAGIDTVTSSPRVGEEIAEAGSNSDVGDGYIWSPWLATCQKFASGQPCNQGEMIGFESRECVAKDPSKCQGPFFRYCTLPC